MLHITPQMKILVAVEPADLRRDIDGLGCNIEPDRARIGPEAST
jgi:hypothetical protein